MPAFGIQFTDSLGDIERSYLKNKNKNHRGKNYTYILTVKM